MIEPSEEHCGDFLNDREGATSHVPHNPFEPWTWPTKAEYDPKIHGYNIEFLPLNDDAVVPTKGTEQSAGFDLYASENVMLPPFGVATIPLGFATSMSPEIHGRIESRSGMAVKGFVVLTGVIDADYRGEWKVIMGNLNGEHHHIAKGDRVAQVVLRQTVAASFQPVSELSQTQRGAGGFGSTGTR